MRALVTALLLVLGTSAADACTTGEAPGATIDSRAARAARATCNLDTDNANLFIKVVVSGNVLELHGLPIIVSKLVNLGPKADRLMAAYAMYVEAIVSPDPVTVLVFPWGADMSRLSFKVVGGKVVR